MHHLLSRKLHRSANPVVNSRHQNGQETIKVAPVLDRKIHPNINLLAEELAVSYDASEAGLEVKQEGSDLALSELAGFVGLEPSVRSRRPTKDIHKKDNSKPKER